jgi:hypothetical protein
MIGSTVGLTVGSMVGLTVSLMVGSMVGLTWLCWAINLSKAFDSSDEKLNKPIVLQTCFTGLLFFVLLTAISQEGGNGYYNSDITL